MLHHRQVEVTALKLEARSCGHCFCTIDSSSTSKMSVALGPISLPAPRSPYARSDGTKSCHFDPTDMSWSASVQPLITPFTANVAGPPCLAELSNSFPSISMPL